MIVSLLFFEANFLRSKLGCLVAGCGGTGPQLHVNIDPILARRLLNFGKKGQLKNIKQDDSEIIFSLVLQILPALAYSRESDASRILGSNRHFSLDI